MGKKRGRGASGPCSLAARAPQAREGTIRLRDQWHKKGPRPRWTPRRVGGGGRWATGEVVSGDERRKQDKRDSLQPRLRRSSSLSSRRSVLPTLDLGSMSRNSTY